MIKLIIRKIKKLLCSNSAYIEMLKSEGVRIGEGCDIAKSANFGSEPWLISIGNNVRITQKVSFITHDGGLWVLRRMGRIDSQSVKYGSIKIGDNCNISWNVTIMPNVTIGSNVIIAPGAVVTKSVPDGEIWGGIPARKIETIDEYYEKIKDEMVPTCDMNNDDKLIYLKKHSPQLFE